MVNNAASGEGGGGGGMSTVHRPSAYVILFTNISMQGLSFKCVAFCVYPNFQYISKQLSREMPVLVFLHNF